MIWSKLYVLATIKENVCVFKVRIQLRNRYPAKRQFAAERKDLRKNLKILDYV